MALKQSHYACLLDNVLHLLTCKFRQMCLPPEYIPYARSFICKAAHMLTRMCACITTPDCTHSHPTCHLVLLQFVQWASHVCNKLTAQGFWCDYIDPCSGLPMVHQHTNDVYPEVEGLTVLLGYKTANAGCCKVCLLRAATGILTMQ